MFASLYFIESSIILSFNHYLFCSWKLGNEALDFLLICFLVLNFFPTFHVQNLYLKCFLQNVILKCLNTSEFLVQSQLLSTWVVFCLKVEHLKKILLIFKSESLFKVLSCSNDRLVKYLGKKYSLLKTQNCVKSTIFYLATKSSKKISMQSDSISTETEIKEWLHLDHCIADLIDVEFSIFLWSIETVALWAKIPTEIVMKLEALIMPYFELILIITIYLRSRIKTHTS